MQVEQRPKAPPQQKQPGPSRPPGRPPKAAKGARPGRPKLHTFSYQMVTAQGVKKKGKVRAFNQDQVVSLIAQPGCQIKSIKQHSDALSMELGTRKVKRAELIVFTRQLATFVRAGVPLVDALASIGSANASKGLQDTLRQVTLDLAQGMPLSTSIAHHPGTFPRFYVDLVRAGEVTGNLDQVLQQAANYLQRREEASRKIRAALAYPSVIALMAITAVVILIVFVLPKFVTFFRQFDAKLPLPTRMLLSTSDFLQTWWQVILAIAVLTVVSVVLLVRTEPGKVIWDKTLLSLPMVGKLVRYALIERFCATLATMVTAGVPLVTTFQVVIDGTKNRVFQAGLSAVRDQMLVGQGMSGPLAASDLFPPMVPQMVKVGEDTGSLDEQLDQAASYFADELDYLLTKFTAVFEPVIIIVMGGIVGFVGLALVSAMYGIYKQVQG